MDKGYSVLRDDAIGPKTDLMPSIWGRESDGTPSYPYITGWLQGSIQNAIRQLKSLSSPQRPSMAEIIPIIEDLQRSFDQAEVWCEPYDSPKTEEE